ncbi:MAG: hypothetical protein M1814_005340 [Vezdaea aestivalis]|nr:MAG: hypothetical protein M1814_005340 [Vezdaea aestivalis]
MGSNIPDAFIQALERAAADANVAFGCVPLVKWAGQAPEGKEEIAKATYLIQRFCLAFCAGVKPHNLPQFLGLMSSLDGYLDGLEDSKPKGARLLKALVLGISYKFFDSGQLLRNLLFRSYSEWYKFLEFGSTEWYKMASLRVIEDIPMNKIRSTFCALFSNLQEVVQDPYPKDFEHLRPQTHVDAPDYRHKYWDFLEAVMSLTTSSTIQQSRHTPSLEEIIDVVKISPLWGGRVDLSDNRRLFDIVVSFFSGNMSAPKRARPHSEVTEEQPHVTEKRAKTRGGSRNA